MAVESAADRAAIFSSDEFAEAGTYTPSGGPAVAVAAIVDRGEREIGGDLGGMVAAGPQALIRVDQLASWAEGDALAIGAESWTVRHGVLDESGQVWRLDLRVA